METTLDLNALRRIACPPEIQNKLEKALASLLDLQSAARPVLAAAQEALEMYEDYHGGIREVLKDFPNASPGDIGLDGALYNSTPEVWALYNALADLENASCAAGDIGSQPLKAVTTPKTAEDLSFADGVRNVSPLLAKALDEASTHEEVEEIQHKIADLLAGP